MKTMTGVVIAIFTIGLVFFGFGLRANSRADARQPIAAYAQPAGDARVMVQPVNAFTTSGAQVVPMNAVAQTDPGWQAAPAAQQPVLVNCGPGAQTLVRTVWMNGQQVSQVECLQAGGAAYPGAQVRTVAYDNDVYDARMATRPQAQAYTSQQPAPRRVVSRPQRSWTKTALVIGGTTATGAGIGGLVGGKKGALIGAAIGGGAGTLFEVQKRR
jgi:hypothetical protein